jgi:hypothetical protein
MHITPIVSIFLKAEKNTQKGARASIVALQQRKDQGAHPGESLAFQK